MQCRPFVAGVVLAIACEKPKVAERTPAVSTVSAPRPDTVGGGRARCPADGRWHECSVVIALERAGLAPRRDSASATESGLSFPGMLVRLGRAELSVFLYADEASRVADETRLDRSNIVEAGQPLGIGQERTLIHAVNLLALLKTLNEHQRERVTDVLLAGPPQAPRAAK